MLGWHPSRPLRLELVGRSGFAADAQAGTGESVAAPTRPQTAREDAERLLATHGYPRSKVYRVDAEGPEVVVLARQDNRLMTAYVHLKASAGRVFVRTEEGW